MGNYLVYEWELIGGDYDISSFHFLDSTTGETIGTEQTSGNLNEFRLFNSLFLTGQNTLIGTNRGPLIRKTTISQLSWKWIQRVILFG